MGIKIKEYLDTNGIKQAFLVERTGLSADKISGICSGKRGIDCMEYYKICRALNLDLEYFFRDLEVE